MLMHVNVIICYVRERTSVRVYMPHIPVYTAVVYNVNFYMHRVIYCLIYKLRIAHFNFVF